MYKMKKDVAFVAGAVVAFAAGAVVAFSAGIASAAPIVDYTATVTTLTSDLTTTIVAAVGVGVLVLGARLGWKFFKQFVK